MGIPYESVRPQTNAVLEIHKALGAFGCESFGTMTDNTRMVASVAFDWRGRKIVMEANWEGYARQLVKHSGWRMDDALEHAKRAVFSILRDWIKGQVTAIECGVIDFETAFMPHMLLPNGQRVIDGARSAGVLPRITIEGSRP